MTIMTMARVRRYEPVTERREPILCDCGTLAGWRVFRDGRFDRLELLRFEHGRRHVLVITADMLRTVPIDSGT